MNKPKEVRGVPTQVMIPTPFVYNDLVTEQTVRFNLTNTYFVLSIGPRDYYFNHDGTMDGTGMGCCGQEKSECVQKEEKEVICDKPS